MTTYEYRIIVHEKLYDQNTDEILHEVLNMAFGQLIKEIPNAVREKMELVVGSLDEKTMSRMIRVTYRDDAPVEEEKPEETEATVEAELPDVEAVI